MAIPRSEIRLRLACMWPILLGGETLKLVQNSPNLLSPDYQVKITRGCVYKIIGSDNRYWWIRIYRNYLLEKLYNQLTKTYAA